MKGAGFKNNEIAESLQIAVSTVSIIVNDERAKPYILKAQQRVADGILDLNLRLKAHATEALDEIVDQMRNAEKDIVRQKAAFGILDRAGYTPIQKHTVIQAPEIPEGLGAVVAEAHAELTEVRRTIRFRAPQATELRLAPAQEVAQEVSADDDA